LNKQKITNGKLQLGTHNHLISIFGCAGGIFGFISVSFFLNPLSLY